MSDDRAGTTSTGAAMTRGPDTQATHDAGGEHRLRLFHKMLRIRRFEEKCAELYSASKIRGFLHLHIGEEAVAVGAMQPLTPQDAVVATYREHGHALARGISMDRLMAEMYGKHECCSRGRGGSMHVFDAQARFTAATPSSAEASSLRLGSPLADQMLHRPPHQHNGYRQPRSDYSEDVGRAAAMLNTLAAQRTVARPADRRAAMRSAIAAAMARSKRDIPHYYLSTTIDLSTALTWLRTENEKRSMTERRLPAVLLIKAVALALREVPELNGYWIDGGFKPGTGIHVVSAISLRGGGLVAPALHDADKADLTTLMRTLQDVVARARAESLRSSECSDPTITVTNLGDQGSSRRLASSIRRRSRWSVLGGSRSDHGLGSATIEARPLLTATFSADHRASDGHRGGVFLTAIDRLLQIPEKL